MKPTVLLETYAPVCMAVVIACIVLAVCTDDSPESYIRVDGMTQTEAQALSETETNVNLKVAYQLPVGKNLLFEVYAENPFETDGNRKDHILPFFVGSTDENSRFNDKISIPSSLQKVYVYAPDAGHSECMELNVVNGNIGYDTSPPGEEQGQE